MRFPDRFAAGRALGERLLKEFPDDLDTRIMMTMQKLIGRTPNEVELKILRQTFVEQRIAFAIDEAAAQKLLAIGESKRDDALPVADFAATTILVSAVMNLDEFVMLS